MHRSSLARPSLASEWRALLAVARKEWTIFRRYPSWIMAFIIWPLLFPLGFIFTARALGGPDGAGLETFGAVAGTSDYVSFLVIGTTIYMWLNVTLWDVGFTLRQEQMRGTLESNWLCPVWRISILVGGALTKAGLALVFLAITTLEFRLLFGVQVVRGDAALLLLILLLTIPCIYGLGIAFGSLVLRFKEANALVFLVRGIFMIFCGTTYPLVVLPDWMQTVAAWLPLTYTIRAIRAVGVAEAPLAEVASDLQRLGAFAVALPLAGYLAFHLTERRARRTGTLGHF